MLLTFNGHGDGTDPAPGANGQPPDPHRLCIIDTGPHSRLEIGGELDLGNVHTLLDHLDLVIDVGTGDLDVDMSEVTFCDSSTLTALVTSHRQLRDRGRTLRVTAASPQVERILAISQLQSLLRPSNSPVTSRPRGAPNRS